MGGRLSHIGEDDIDQSIRNNSNPLIKELMETFKEHRETVKTRLVNLEFKRKLDRWVPNNLIAKQRVDLIAGCVSLFSRYENDPLLIQIGTGEKWAMYLNVKHRKFCLSTCIDFESLTPSQECGIECFVLC
ncbi:hypothetical protein TNCV_709711 [Trichonephila clavipes]|nr:hypothetical protein TNCV_709711 [Trichonephila clavipes]